MSALPDSIASRITVDPVSGCWKVTGNLDKGGYARIAGEGVHRVVYKLLVGPIPEGLVLDHVEAWGASGGAAHGQRTSSRSPPAINVMRGNSPHAINARKDRCDNGHEYDLYTTYYRPNGHRDCRICIRARVKKYQRRLRDAAKAAAPIELRPAA